MSTYGSWKRRDRSEYKVTLEQKNILIYIKIISKKYQILISQEVINMSRTKMTTNEKSESWFKNKLSKVVTNREDFLKIYIEVCGILCNYESCIRAKHIGENSNEYFDKLISFEEFFEALESCESNIEKIDVFCLLIEVLNKLLKDLKEDFKRESVEYDRYLMKIANNGLLVKPLEKHDRAADKYRKHPKYTDTAKVEKR